MKVVIIFCKMAFWGTIPILEKEGISYLNIRCFDVFAYKILISNRAFFVEV